MGLISSQTLPGVTKRITMKRTIDCGLICKRLSAPIYFLNSDGGLVEKDPFSWLHRCIFIYWWPYEGQKGRKSAVNMSLIHLSHKS